MRGTGQTGQEEGSGSWELRFPNRPGRTRAPQRVWKGCECRSKREIGSLLLINTEEWSLTMGTCLVPSKEAFVTCWLKGGLWRNEKPRLLGASPYLLMEWFLSFSLEGQVRPESTERQKKVTIWKLPNCAWDWQRPLKLSEPLYCDPMQPPAMEEVSSSPSSGSLSWLSQRGKPNSLL
jgi:hypothetical protein